LKETYKKSNFEGDAEDPPRVDIPILSRELGQICHYWKWEHVYMQAHTVMSH